MIRYREQLKNYQCEMSINNFYQHPHFKQYANQESIRSNISPSINIDIKNKFITELKKVKQKAVSLININKTPIENIPKNDPTPIPFIEKKKPPQPIQNTIPIEKVTFDNDLSYFLCSVISELDKCGLNISDFKFNSIKHINEKIRQKANIEQKNLTTTNNLNTEISSNLQEKPVLKSSKNIIPVFLRKRFSTSGLCFIDRMVCDENNNNIFDQEYNSINNNINNTSDYIPSYEMFTCPEYQS